MKKFLSLALCVIIAVSFCACGKKQNNKKDSIDVEYYALLGQMPEVEYALGADVDQIIADLDALDSESATDDGHGHEGGYMTYEAGERTIIATGNVNYYYDTEKKADGISYIVNFGDAYGFLQGSILADVKQAMEDLGFTAEREDVGSEDIFFLPVTDGLEVLEYKFQDNTVLFVFQNNCLCACSLFK